MEHQDGIRKRSKCQVKCPNPPSYTVGMWTIGKDSALGSQPQPLSRVKISDHQMTCEVGNVHVNSFMWMLQSHMGHSHEKLLYISIPKQRVLNSATEQTHKNEQTYHVIHHLQSNWPTTVSAQVLNDCNMLGSSLTAMCNNLINTNSLTMNMKALSPGS